MKTVLLISCAFFGQQPLAVSAAIVVNWSTTRELYSIGLPGPLSAGSPIDGDGALLELGYFSMATTTDPFAGTWVELATGSIGDQGGLGDGLFSITSILEEGSVEAPSIGTPLGVRFYDGSSVASSTYYNTAVNLDGFSLWPTPADPAPTVDLELAKGPTEFENRFGPFQARIAIPEPSVPLLGCFALGWLTVRKRRSR